jgi:deazaflavin-dependent oxidoreductase (nitroreductase family)
MNEQIQRALQTDRTIDITTTGRKSGEPRRIEIWFHNIDGRLYITGTPGPRDWYATLVENPHFIFHLKESVQADLPARAVPIADEAQKRRVLSAIIARLEGDRDIEAWVQDSPLVEVILESE